MRRLLREVFTLTGRIQWTAGSAPRLPRHFNYTPPEPVLSQESAAHEEKLARELQRTQRGTIAH